ncbi:phage tail protein [[Actinobacillus] muris]|uniref:Phage tail protein n=1 Tax=Muribacter muris TaxID=67855 RepID=A0A0J5S0U2_9PAST|nr:phage tail protein [Muribacter muris]KMK50477.1 phage tail protein [[Actinobacillus] muris] [Muribacter muris]MBF0783886.1 phage tail protein [Muribacter muris]MBF0826384.1 phage tail protein [Muribacter muris]TFV13285.1 phage tail protein [Muribacter muris]
MLKPDRLRDLLTQSIAYFQQNPDQLILQFDNGNLKLTGAASLSFEYHYDLEVIATDFPYHPDVLFVPILNFVRIEQSELLLNPANQSKITFEIEPNNHKTYDIYIKIPLTERVIVKEQEGEFTAKHGNEPQPTEWIPLERWRLYHFDRLIFDSQAQTNDDY